ncbi:MULTISPECIES: hypothetical protein [Flavobacteriaceae]|uniref:hypothetical protein n=1 Tax=Flavobacteriaceae TaxID=49546 RepID=UPI001492C371|nr:MULTISPECIES: hypothetical protein [Allomuricauda]MDC6366284.1 hypothetical protein [Muricauda sp. AC10]
MEHKRDIEKRMEKKMEYYVTKVFKVFMMVVLGIGLFLLANYVLMRLWNWLMPDIFGLTTINYWQALGIFIIAKLLFGFGFGGDDKKSKSKHKKNWKSSHKCSSLRRDFDEWKHYDQFWKEEGEEAYKSYIERIKNENHDTL